MGYRGTFSWSPWQTIKHQYFDALGLIGLRDRLRCPACMAVGTWKPHGGWYDRLLEWKTDFRSQLRPGVRQATNRRWLCKYCGYNLSSTGRFWCQPDSEKGVWSHEIGPNSQLTPKQLVGDVWPWRG